MWSHEEMHCYHCINTYLYVYSDNNLCVMSCVCAGSMRDWGVCSRGEGGCTAMQKAGGEVYRVCVEREEYAKMRGGWKQNRTALTTEPKDKGRIGLADRRDCLGAWSCYMKGDSKRTASVWQPKAPRGKHITDTSPSALSTVTNHREFLCAGNMT